MCCPDGFDVISVVEHLHRELLGSVHFLSELVFLEEREDHVEPGLYYEVERSFVVFEVVVLEEAALLQKLRDLENGRAVLHLVEEVGDFFCLGELRLN